MLTIRLRKHEVASSDHPCQPDLGYFAPFHRQFLGIGEYHSSLQIPEKPT